VSRYTKAAPGGRCIVLDDGYQLCARCGEVHCTADRVVAVYRTGWWGIHTHLPGPGCPAKAVSGWRAVELALDMRESNIPTPREAFPVTISGFTLPFVSLLDNEHCTAEMEVVTIWRKEFLPSKLSLSEGDNDNHKLLSNLVENQGDRRDWGLWQDWAVPIVAVASLRSRLAEITRDVLQQERASLYVERSGWWSAVSLSEKDERPILKAISPPGSSSLPGRTSKSRAQQRKSRRTKQPPPGALSHTLTRDALGKSGEYALYSQQELTDGRRVLKFGELPLDEFSLYRPSGRQSRPARLPFDSARCPEMFDWSDEGVPKELVEHWRGNPRSSPYGPVARLKPAFLATLRNSN
jgi:hypothetical protein